MIKADFLGIPKLKLALIAATLFVLPVASLAQQIDLGSGSVVEAVTHLKPGQFVWAPQVAPQGPMLLIVNISTQRAVLFRNGVPIAASTVSTGRPGHSTPTGIFTILQKQIEHYSSLYDSAPMPYMQRLTWQGVALHAGNLPGYPASHGCIRLPAGFARLLYGQTRVGMTVVITHEQTTPRVAPSPTIVADGMDGPVRGEFVWAPANAPEGPVSILISAADRSVLVLRNGIIIGKAPITIDGAVTGTWSYALRGVDAQGQHWVRLTLSEKSREGEEVSKGEWGRFHAPDNFKQAVSNIIQPGTTIIVTSDSLIAANSLKPVTVLKAPNE